METGIHNFSSLVQSSLPTDIVSAMEMTVAEKGWFVLVRRTRKNLGDTRTEDEFSDEKSKLRAWVGI